MAKAREKTYTTFDISRMCDVYPTTVAKWIDGGKLKSYSTPGGHRRVCYGDLMEFLKKYGVPVPDELVRPARTKILIVDDDKAVLKTIVRIFNSKKEKYEVFTARDGFQAGHMTGDLKPRIIVLDIMLPGLDGFSVCRAIKEKNINTKILAITGFDSPVVREKIFKAGADDYLPKPFGMRKFMKKIQEMEESPAK